MIRPEIKSDGSNNWSDVDWDKDDAGEYTNLCPDKRRSDFEYGSILIAESAMQGPVHKFFEPQSLAPSKIIRELEQVINSLNSLSPDTRMHLNVMGRLFDPVIQVRNFFQRSIDQPPPARAKGPDEARQILANDAWSIWSHHNGDIHSTNFLGYVERLLDNAHFTSEIGKGRVNPNNLVREIRLISDQKSPLPWRLWE